MMHHLIATLAAAAAFLAVPASAQDMTAPLPPLMPWSGASERLVAAPNDPWITPAEARNLAETPSYAETRAYIDRLVAASPLLSIETFGRTAQGRELYAVRAAKPGGGRKPVLLAQAGIHSGEIDGKDAGLMLLRDIALRGKHNLLDRADLILVPIFNTDGHERASAYNRPNQRGPRNQGWRTTAQNLNLNRDYLKADTPEMRAMRAFINRLDPALILDLHVSDGIDYQYDITFTFPGWRGSPTHSPAIGRWLDARYRPAVTAALARGGHIPGLYIEPIDPEQPYKGAALSPDTPRFSTGYGELARQPTVLVETHSLKPYRQRVLGTYLLIEESLRLVGAEHQGLERAIATDRAARPKTAVLTWKPRATPLFTIPDFKGIAFETYRSPASGGNEIRWLGRPMNVSLPVFVQAPDTVVTLPAAWWVPAHHVGDGEALHAHAKANGLEGLIAKRIDSPYVPGKRTPNWRKVKIRRGQELVVGGWLPGEGNRTGSLGALLVGYHDDTGLRYAGRVGTGFNEAELRRVQGRLDSLAADASPFVEDPPPPVRKKARWVRPEMVVQVEFGEWTVDGVLRHPSYLGERTDKDPRDVVREP